MNDSADARLLNEMEIDEFFKTHEPSQWNFHNYITIKHIQLDKKQFNSCKQAYVKSINTILSEKKLSSYVKTVVGRIASIIKVLRTFFIYFLFLSDTNFRTWNMIIIVKKGHMKAVQVYQSQVAQ
jgi:hypothetical protein